MRLLSAFCLFSVLCWGAQLREVQIAPQVAYIHGSGSSHHLLFTAVYDDGTERDVTEQVKLTFDSPDVLEMGSPGQVKARCHRAAQAHGGSGFHSRCGAYLYPNGL